MSTRKGSHDASRWGRGTPSCLSLLLLIPLRKWKLLTVVALEWLLRGCRLCEMKTQCQWMRRGGLGSRWQTSKFIFQLKGASQLSQMTSRGIGPIVGNFSTFPIKAKFFIFMWNFLIFQGWQVFRFFKYQAGWQHICGPGLSARMPVLTFCLICCQFSSSSTILPPARF